MGEEAGLAESDPNSNAEVTASPTNPRGGSAAKMVCSRTTTLARCGQALRAPCAQSLPGTAQEGRGLRSEAEIDPGGAAFGGITPPWLLLYYSTCCLTDCLTEVQGEHHPSIHSQYAVGRIQTCFQTDLLSKLRPLRTIQEDSK